MTNTAVPVQPAAVQQLQLQQQQLQQQQLQQQQLTQQLQQQQLQQQQQSAQVIAAQQAEVRAKIEEETQKKIAESSISHEENMSISGSNARYMVMQKLSRKTEVRRGRLEFSLSCIQLFRERLLEKVHATIPKGIVGGFVCPVLQRKLKEWHERPRTYVCEC